MQRLGFIHDMMDVKLLVLLVMSRVSKPVNVQQIYELCYQDECLSYFDICQAVPEMVQSGHLQQVEDECYEITEKGRSDGALMETGLAYSVRCKAEDAVARFNRENRRGDTIKTRVEQKENGEYQVVMELNDKNGQLMTLILTAPDQRQGAKLARLFERKAESVYSLTMMELLEDEGETE